MRIIQTFITTATVALTSAAFASGPAGVWSRPDSVTIFEADSDNPLVVIDGLFTVWTGTGLIGEDWGMLGYEAAAWGRMSYTCKTGDKTMCLMQWEEIRTAASEDGCVGWGNQEDFAGTVHATTDAFNPDDYPINQGVIAGVTPCNYLAGIPAQEPPPDESPEPSPEEAKADLPPADPGPEPSPEEAVESTTDTTVTTDTSVTTDSGVGSDSGDGGDAVGGVDATGGGCNGAGAGLLPGLGALLGFVGLGLRRRR